ncbi:PLP-dependent aminotransferase family protein [Caldalkalibacillus mannanilyticus]|uniref:aminotransferase-like domain-containing protein n=1 Tax=Caldalkalibacillus mannanilyticus TaxID=1418 RepID=UPI000550DFBC|nr:PLP-dependent aminotransferase family protein [Caldalkalibacillus mannanilyticus]
MYKYQALFQRMEELIQNEQYKTGAKLPSIRSLAEQYVCSKSTVIKVFQELEKRHLVYSVPKSGYYVVKRSFEGKESKGTKIDFATSAPDWSHFPYVDFQHCINKAIDTYQHELFVYGTPQGLPSLIEIVQKQLEGYQVFAKSEQIFITSGVQQALAILNSLPFPNRKTKILIEQPSYHLLIQHAEMNNLPMLGIRRSAEGLNFAELEKLFREEDIKFFYTMPRFHNPLGTSYSQKEMKELVRLADQYDVYLVEDDYLADYEQDSKIDPLYAYDVNERVIYLKSYSKIMFPGLRVGVAVVPRAIMEAFQQYKKILDIDSSMISQAALEIYIKSGMFERHKKRIRESYISRARLLYEALVKHQNDRFTMGNRNPSSSLCMHTHIVLPSTTNMNQFMRRLEKEEVLIESVNRNYMNGFPQEKIVKINVFNVEESMIEEGVRRLVRSR